MPAHAPCRARSTAGPRYRPCRSRRAHHWCRRGWPAGRCLIQGSRWMTARSGVRRTRESAISGRTALIHRRQRPGRAAGRRRWAHRTPELAESIAQEQQRRQGENLDGAEYVGVWNVAHVVELRGIEPLTYSMRTRRGGGWPGIVRRQWGVLAVAQGSGGSWRCCTPRLYSTNIAQLAPAASLLHGGVGLCFPPSTTCRCN